MRCYCQYQVKRQLLISEQKPVSKKKTTTLTGMLLCRLYQNNSMFSNNTRILNNPSPPTWLLNKESPTSCTFEFRQVFLIDLIVGLRRMTLLASMPLGLMRPIVVRVPVDTILHHLLGIKPKALLVIRLRRHFSTHTGHNLNYEHF